MSPSNRRWLIALVSCGIIAFPVSWYGCARMGSPTKEESSLAKISVAGFRQVGQTTETQLDGEGDAYAAYIGPDSGDAAMIERIAGPGVTITLLNPLPQVSGEHDALWIGRGISPFGCSLALYKYVPGRPAIYYWTVTTAELAKVNAGKLEIVEIAVTCGSG